MGGNNIVGTVYTHPVCSVCNVERQKESRHALNTAAQCTDWPLTNFRKVDEPEVGRLVVI